MKLIHIKLLLTAIFWGGTFIAGRALSDHVAPFSAAFLRFVIASIPLLILTYRMEGRFPPIQKEKLFYLLLLGLTGVFSYNVFFFKGLRLIHAGRASLIIANNPIFIAMASFFLFKEKLNAVKIVGILVSVTGAMIAISRGNLQGMLTESFGFGDLFIFLAVLSWVTYSLIGKRVMQDVSAIEAVTYASVTGAVMLFPAALAEGMPTDIFNYTLSNWFSLLYLGIFGTVLGFVWYYEGIKKIGPSKASLFINFVPISAIVLAFLFLDEPITLSLLAGAAMVSLGVYLTNTGSLFQLRSFVSAQK
ncbi:MAG: DMT family transporter [Deltaproteobacteria bacterium]|jgi:drug/metabolite transporter (DMT)-like permease|nr:DMT family transporter [Deltaproteobacteria bacterium]